MKKMVIKISDEDYQAIKSGYLPYGVIADAIKQGILLPEYHGRIIDESKITSIYYHEESYYRMVIDGTDAPTIIDRSESE